MIKIDIRVRGITIARTVFAAGVITALLASGYAKFLHSKHPTTCSVLSRSVCDPTLSLN